MSLPIPSPGVPSDPPILMRCFMKANYELKKERSIELSAIIFVFECGSLALDTIAIPWIIHCPLIQG